jgi:hypothetical protein
VLNAPLVLIPCRHTVPFAARPPRAPKNFRRPACAVRRKFLLVPKATYKWSLFPNVQTQSPRAFFLTKNASAVACAGHGSSPLLGANDRYEICDKNDKNTRPIRASWRQQEPHACQHISACPRMKPRGRGACYPQRISILTPWFPRHRGETWGAGPFIGEHEFIPHSGLALLMGCWLRRSEDAQPRYRDSAQNPSR